MLPHARRVTFASALAMICLATIRTASAQTFIAEDFNRPDGPVGNGWTTFHAGANNSPDITLENGQLKTFGANAQGGGIYRTLSVTFPLTFSFQFRTQFPADGGWWIRFNSDTSFQGNVPPLKDQLDFYQIRGSGTVQRDYLTDFNSIASMSVGDPNQRNYRPDILATISGTINADFSSILSITYDDGVTPDTVSLFFPKVSDAAAAPPGTTFILMNSDATAGPHFFDNLLVRAVPEPGALAMLTGMAVYGSRMFVRRRRRG